MTARPWHYRLAGATGALVVLALAWAQQPALRWREDASYRYLESKGLPEHAMMVGITAWQQQVPLPHDFTGANAFRIPKRPVKARTPISAKEALFTGAIAVAINGVPIFNPIKNDGVTDTYLAGELDNFGGHCGRADDYHYHVAPLHLQTLAGEGKPIGWALDGYPLYGLADHGAALDAFNGHVHAGENDEAYHYHATENYPYVNGGLRGEVTVEDDAITPQPRTIPVRPAGHPLRGARIVGFSHPATNRYTLDYDIGGERRSIHYTIDDPRTFTFTFIDGAGAQRTENYTRSADRGKKRKKR